MTERRRERFGDSPAARRQSGGGAGRIRTMDECASAAQVAAVLQDLAESGMAAEAMVRLRRLRAPDQAEAIALMSPHSRVSALRLMPRHDVAAVIEELDTELAVEICQALDAAALSDILDATSPDIAADVLRGVPQEVAASAIPQMRDAYEVIPLLEYEDDDAGGLMTPEVIALREAMTARQAMDFARRWADETEPHPEDTHYLFVVDEDDVLRGGLSMAQLALAAPGQRVSLLMDEDIISVGVETDQEEAARLMEHYDIFSLPVVDADKRLVGALRLDDMVDVLEDEATEDMYRMIGVAEEEKALGPFWRSVRNRLPWLAVNLGTAVLAGLVITLFDATMARMTLLAAFLPVIAGQGGIAGTQTLTLIIRSMTLGEVATGDARRLLVKEIGLGLVHGLALGAAIGALAYAFWGYNEYLALVVGVSMMANLVVAGISGVIVPLGFRAMKIDPALSSAVAVTTLTDVLGFLIYLGLATALIRLIAPV